MRISKQKKSGKRSKISTLKKKKQCSQNDLTTIVKRKQKTNMSKTKMSKTKMSKTKKNKKTKKTKKTNNQRSFGGTSDDKLKNKITIKVTDYEENKHPTVSIYMEDKDTCKNMNNFFLGFHDGMYKLFSSECKEDEDANSTSPTRSWTCKHYSFDVISNVTKVEDIILHDNIYTCMQILIERFDVIVKMYNGNPQEETWDSQFKNVLVYLKMDHFGKHINICIFDIYTCTQAVIDSIVSPSVQTTQGNNTINIIDITPNTGRKQMLHPLNHNAPTDRQTFNPKPPQNPPTSFGPRSSKYTQGNLAKGPPPASRGNLAPTQPKGPPPASRGRPMGSSYPTSTIQNYTTIDYTRVKEPSTLPGTVGNGTVPYVGTAPISSSHPTSTRATFDITPNTGRKQTLQPLNHNALIVKKNTNTKIPTITR